LLLRRSSVGQNNVIDTGAIIVSQRSIVESISTRQSRAAAMQSERRDGFVLDERGLRAAG
jgi:hypothetical protein